MLRKLVRLQPILSGTVVALVFGYLLGRLMLSRFDEGPPPRVDRVVLPAEHGLNDPSIPPIRLHGTLVAADVPLQGTIALQPVVGPSEVPPGRVVAEVDAEGSFTLDVLAGPGPYLAFFESAAEDGDPLPKVVQLPIQVPSTDELRIDVELPNGRILGSVLDPAGTPLADVPVELRRYETDEVFAVTTSDATGSFGFRCLPREVYTVAARRDDGSPAEENVHLLDEATRSLMLTLGE